MPIMPHLIWAVMLGANQPPRPLGEVNADTARNFARLYAAWREYRESGAVRILSHAAPMFESRQFKDIVALGPRVVPLLVEKLESDPNCWPLGKAIEEVARLKLRRRYDKIARRTVFADFPEMPERVNPYAYWWRTGRRMRRTKFDGAYEKWKAARLSGVTTLRTEVAALQPESFTIENVVHKTSLGEAYEEMRSMGIDILPLLIQKFNDGDHDLLPLFGELTDGRGITHIGSLKDRVRFTLEWWEKNKEDWLLPPAEEEPKEFGGHDPE